jgi:hypothetical protein
MTAADFNLIMAQDGIRKLGERIQRIMNDNSPEAEARRALWHRTPRRRHQERADLKERYFYALYGRGSNRMRTEAIDALQKFDAETARLDAEGWPGYEESR